MMISPEWFYKQELKGKTAEEIMTVIRGLKQRMGKLKNVMEHPDYCSMICPSEDVRLWSNRLYLEKAKEALAEAGGVYKPSKAELRARDFDENIAAIREISVSYEGFGWYPEVMLCSITVEEDGPHQNGKRLQCDWNPKEFVNKQDFLDAIRGLHLGEWRRNYGTERFGICILDGIQWEVTVRFSNGHRVVKFEGSNAFPYNFKDFLRVLRGDSRFVLMAFKKTNP